MGKKRKAGARGAAEDPSDRSVSEPKVRLDIQSYEDVAGSEDEFHLHRDKILLDEGPERKRQRQLAEHDAFFEPSDEEVLSVPASDAGDESSEPEVNGEEDAAAAAEDDDDRSDESEAAPEDDVDREGWGTAKRDYYNADAIETEADALEEEQEALRLQTRQLQDMKASDYGLDDYDLSAPAGGNGVRGGVVNEVLPAAVIKETTTDEEKRQMLALRYPEFEPLSKEFLALQPTYRQLSAAAKDAEDARARRKAGPDDSVDPPLAVIKQNALSSYLGALTMYFALLTAGSASSNGTKIARAPAELRDHAVMEALVYTRALWDRLRYVPLPDPEEEDIVDIDFPADAVDAPELAIPREATNGDAHAKKKKHRKSKAQKAAEQALAAAQAEREARTARTEAELSALSAPLPSRKPAATETMPDTAAGEGDDDGSDFGDAEALTAEEAEAKAKRRRGLRFYTSQITQKSMKRDRLSRDGGGDTDIPYRERFRDRQARLNAEAGARGRKQPAAGAELGGDSDEEDRQARRELRGGEGGGEEDYYDMVAARTKRKRASKEAHAAAAAEGQGPVRQVEVVGPDGKRAITYEIQKNKGLTPRRKKEARNPRVKKRKKFEEKTKKLGSMRQVYRGGEGRGGYGGELTGIKKNLVKSVKL